MNLSISYLLDIFYGWVKDLSFFWDYITTPLIDFVPKFSLAHGALSLLGLSDVSLLYLMIGAGLGVFVAYTIATWILNLIT